MVFILGESLRWKKFVTFIALGGYFGLLYLVFWETRKLRGRRIYVSLAWVIPVVVCWCILMPVSSSSSSRSNSSKFSWSLFKRHTLPKSCFWNLRVLVRREGFLRLFFYFFFNSYSCISENSNSSFWLNDEVYIVKRLTLKFPPSF